MERLFRCVMAAGAVLLASSVARANTDIVVLSDGRSVGMGGVGVALNETGSAPFHNPAGLAAVKTFTGTLTFTPFLTRLQAPFPNAATGQPETHSSTTSFAPLGLLGAGVRVHERVVLGVAAYLTAGSGAAYQGAVAGFDVKANAVAGEVQIPVALNLTDRLSVGAAYRITAARIGADVPVLAGPGGPLVPTSTTLSGVDGTGFVLGARYQVSDYLRLGVAYRNKVAVTVRGQTKSGDVVLQDGVEQTVALPHTFRLGSAFFLLDKKLTIAVDGIYWLYSDSHPADVAAGRPQAWKDAILGLAGAEYMLTTHVPVRLGGNVGTSATSDGSAGPFVPAPGINVGVNIGSGVRLGRVDIDFATGYAAQLGKTIAQGANAGEYRGASVLFSASATYRL
jgi:long-subunit fatty acid transport protein